MSLQTSLGTPDADQSLFAHLVDSLIKLLCSTINLFERFLLVLCIGLGNTSVLESLVEFLCSSDCNSCCILNDCVKEYRCPTGLA